MVAITRPAAASRLRDPQQGIRPFDVGRDLRAVSRLITEAFADELDEQGEAALRELRILGYMSGLVRILYRSTGEFRNVFNGFVWVENRRVVGNVTVQRAASGSGRWQIANVAVSPAWRGRGIQPRADGACPGLYPRYGRVLGCSAGTGGRTRSHAAFMNGFVSRIWEERRNFMRRSCRNR